MTNLINYTTPSMLFITHEDQTLEMLGYALANDFEVVSYIHNRSYDYDDIHDSLNRLIDDLSNGWYRRIIIHNREHIKDSYSIESYASLCGVYINYVLQDDQSMNCVAFENTFNINTIV